MALLDMEAEYRPVRDAVLKFAVVHRPGNQHGTAKIPGGGQPGEFIHPFEKLASEKFAVMIQMLGPDKRKCIHTIVLPHLFYAYV